jgi:hypothetical protein
MHSRRNIMKKRLLNEVEIRKLMKFANLGSLTETFVDRLEEDEMEEDLYEQENEEEPGLGDPAGDVPQPDASEEPVDDLGLDDEGLDDEGLDDEGLDDEGLDDEGPEADADPAAVESAVRDILDMVMGQVEEKYGEAAPEMSVEEPGEEDLGDLDAEEDLGLPPSALDPGADEFGDEEDEDLGGLEDEDLGGLEEQNVTGKTVAKHKGKDVKQIGAGPGPKTHPAYDTPQAKRAAKGKGKLTVDEDLEELEEADIYLEDDDLVNEVARRVAKKLLFR